VTGHLASRLAGWCSSPRRRRLSMRSTFPRAHDRGRSSTGRRPRSRALRVRRPEGREDDAVGVVDELHRRLGRRGVYAVVAGGHFRAQASDLAAGKAGKLATAAFRAHHVEGTGPTLADFVDRVGLAAKGDGGGGGGNGAGRIVLPILVVAGPGRLREA
jgi:hypothetical protein